jgi:hypothetical protein
MQMDENLVQFRDIDLCGRGDLDPIGLPSAV